LDSALHEEAARGSDIGGVAAAAAAASSATISKHARDAPPLTSSLCIFTNLQFIIGSIFYKRALVVCKKMEVAHVTRHHPNLKVLKAEQ
jgi:hypothetical protein